MKMRRYLLGAGVLVIVGMGGACSHESKYQSQRKAGQRVGEAVATKAQFADQLSLLDEKQIALGKLALQKSSNTEVRAFAQQLIDNHQQHLSSLDKYADTAALRLAVIDLSTESSVSGSGGAGGAGGAGMEGASEAAQKQSSKYDEKLDKQILSFKNEIRDLSAKSGPDFDMAFLEQVRRDQRRGRELIERGLKDYSDDASLALLLGRTAPVLERQEERANALRGAKG